MKHSESLCHKRETSIEEHFDQGEEHIVYGLLPWALWHAGAAGRLPHSFAGTQLRSFEPIWGLAEACQVYVMQVEFAMGLVSMPQSEMRRLKLDLRFRVEGLCLAASWFWEPLQAKDTPQGPSWPCLLFAVAFSLNAMLGQDKGLGVSLSRCCCGSGSFNHSFGP